MADDPRSDSEEGSIYDWLVSTLAPVKDAAYFVSPPDGAGPALLLLHSWWGLDSPTRRLADRISDAGYTVLVPDLLVGETFESAPDAEAYLASLDANRMASLTQSSAYLVQERSSDRDRPIAAVGLSMGASLALWASVRVPDVIDRVVSFYGSQSIDFTGSKAAYQLHFAEHDELVDSDEAGFMEATIGLEGLAIESHVYAGTSHWFFEPGRPNYDALSSEQAWQRMIHFLAGPLN